MLTPYIVMFIENTIRNCTMEVGGISGQSAHTIRAPAESFKPKLMSWTSMKQTIFEIFDDRIL
jgi:hypothetical protein